jgi:hypothetical protein
MSATHFMEVAVREHFWSLASRTLSAGLLVSAFLVFTQRDAHAYLDAGTGSMLIQVVMGSALAGLFAIKVFWRRAIHAFNHRVLRRKEEEAPTDVDVRN